jgi:hypothetical protein
VNDGATRAEDIHKRIANLPLDVLAEAGPLEATVKRVRDLQDRSIHAVYDLVRDINHQVVRLANDVLPAPRRKAAPRKKATGRKDAADATAKTTKPAAA